MSLKAKLEAVIYAAEEPVTLAQLASIFAEDAFAWRAEQEAVRQNEHHAAGTVVLGAFDAADSSQDRSENISANGLSSPEPSASSELPEPENTPSHATPSAEPAAPPNTELPADTAPDSAEPPKPSGVTDAELEARRLERKREREVKEILRGVLDELIAEYADSSRGVEIREIAGGFRMGTKPEIHDAVRVFVKSLKPALKLSLPALETLAVIAYRQPVTAPEVGDIRGVDSAGVLGSLMSRKLITTAGRKQVIGRPMLYKTTKEFLLRFGLKDINELPSMEEFEKMAAMELSEPETDEDSATAPEQSGDLFAESETASPVQSPAPEAAINDVEQPPLHQEPLEQNQPGPETMHSEALPVASPDAQGEEDEK